MDSIDAFLRYIETEGRRLSLLVDTAVTAARDKPVNRLTGVFEAGNSSLICIVARLHPFRTDFHLYEVAQGLAVHRGLDTMLDDAERRGEAVEGARLKFRIVKSNGGGINGNRRPWR
ncbi:hypothetical protein HYU15_04095 [Candidatus Woesearchaeota archaeon]|nr:hypothetical protein [Candidatus Woesearchaeota archaeon]